MSSHTYRKRLSAKRKQWSINANAKLARMRLESPPDEESQYQRMRRENVLMKIITVTDPRTGETNRLQVWNGRTARVNQVAVIVNGRPWKNLGKTRLAKGLAEAILR